MFLWFLALGLSLKLPDIATGAACPPINGVVINTDLCKTARVRPKFQYHMMPMARQMRVRTSTLQLGISNIVLAYIFATYLLNFTSTYKLLLLAKCRN